MEGEPAFSVPQNKTKNTPHTLVLEHVSPATRLLEKRRQMFEVQEMLEFQKQEFSRKEDVFKRREEKLKKKDLELQEQLIRFSKFLQENDGKKQRAEKKIHDERRVKQQKEQEIEALNVSLASLKETKVSKFDDVEKNYRYQKYLEAVQEYADEYHEITDILQRHETLQQANEDLRQQAAECAEKNEDTRAALQAYTKAKTDEILNLNNQISRLKKDLELKEREVLSMAGDRELAVRNASQRMLELGQVVMASDNLFQRCRQKSNVNHVAYSSPIDQLGVIGEYMADLSSIVRSKRASNK
mmetsp:Transcript_13056/g.45270  ORF Transcript_13056/g.45270 Transcript_13056/m.45270 type:complete len:300 (+) Transcript_13056:157-1056(+)|eukprot:CAMPEP_0183815598 /NCGR_PEP_ID=MMETSP0803_2-20130417/57194_1 /TAXON_ID=195967 /ORGANISM="Crustomastix stigmata, Strain CCMP3273" /LENGTH=299 /DNA_ID=CAMNT_0026060463 /DNA_START=151 /DNA_END=1050 /DNA_ORIENTATION=-